MRRNAEYFLKQNKKKKNHSRVCLLYKSSFMVTRQYCTIPSKEDKKISHISECTSKQAKR